MHSRVRDLACGGAAAACAAAALAFAPAAGAEVNNVAICRTTAQVTMHGGRYHAARTGFDCSGLLAGALVAPSGSVEMWGNYTTRTAGAGCQVSFANTVFYAQQYRALALLDYGGLEAEGGFSLSAGPLMSITGSGQTGDSPFLAAGGASFTPDHHSCAAVTGGTLSATLVLTDGGSGNPAASAQITRDLEAEYGGQPAAVSGRR